MTNHIKRNETSRHAARISLVCDITKSKEDTEFKYLNVTEGPIEYYVSQQQNQIYENLFFTIFLNNLLFDTKVTTVYYFFEFTMIFSKNKYLLKPY